MGLVLLSKWLTCVMTEAYTDPCVFNGTDFGLWAKCSNLWIAFLYSSLFYNLLTFTWTNKLSSSSWHVYTQVDTNGFEMPGTAISLIPGVWPLTTKIHHNASVNMPQVKMSSKYSHLQFPQWKGYNKETKNKQLDPFFNVLNLIICTIRFVLYDDLIMICLVIYIWTVNKLMRFL